MLSTSIAASSIPLRGILPLHLDKKPIFSIIVSMQLYFIGREMEMKSRIIGIVAVLLVVCSGVSFASEGVEVEAGIKGWYNKLELKDPEEK